MNIFNIKLCLFIVICLFISCYNVDSPNYINSEYIWKNTCYTYDTIYINKAIQKLPYNNDTILIYSDSSANNNIIYNNHYLYLKILLDYKIESIKWFNTSIRKTIELTHTPKERKYWCVDTVQIDSIKIVLTNIQR